MSVTVKKVVRFLMVMMVKTKIEKGGVLDESQVIHARQVKDHLLL